MKKEQPDQGGFVNWVKRGAKRVASWISSDDSSSSSSAAARSEYQQVEPKSKIRRVEKPFSAELESALNFIVYENVVCKKLVRTCVFRSERKDAFTIQKINALKTYVEKKFAEAMAKIASASTKERLLRDENFAFLWDIVFGDYQKAMNAFEKRMIVNDVQACGLSFQANQQCPVCQDDGLDVLMLPVCHHGVCFPCLTEMVIRNMAEKSVGSIAENVQLVCPSCRAVVAAQVMRFIEARDEYGPKLAQALLVAEENRRNELAHKEVEDAVNAARLNCVQIGLDSDVIVAAGSVAALGVLPDDQRQAATVLLAAYARQQEFEQNHRV